jgi:hypothetical protein
LKIRVLKAIFYSDAILRGGAAYLINNNLQIDASITNFKDTPTVLYGGIGFSWRYDGNQRSANQYRQQ